MAEITGHYKAKGAVKTLDNGKTVSKFYLDIDKESKYPSIGEFELYDKEELLNGINPGDKITVKFDVRGRKWTSPEGKEYFFQSLSVWAINKETETASVSPPAKTPESMSVSEDQDDLPF